MSASPAPFRSIPRSEQTPSLVRDGTPSGQPSTKLAGFTDVIKAGAELHVRRNTLVVPPSNQRPRPGRQPERAVCRALHTGGTRLHHARLAGAGERRHHTQADTEQAVQTTLASKLSAQSGVNMDTEMSHMIQLQNAYGANARVIATVQAMWTQLLQAVQ